jgi:SAM-dependent methyltransferase
VARIFRRGLQLSRGAAASGLTARPRTVRPEILDQLPPAAARAIRSRRDLQRVNRVMGSCGILTRAVRGALAPAPQHAPLRILELGAGDGTLALRIAPHLAMSWPVAELTLLDRQALIAEATGTAFARLGWTLRPLTVDALEWARAPTRQQPSDRWDLVVTNLFLHHFEEDGLRELLSAVADRCDAFVACEPRRSLPALVGGRLLFALGVSADTRHDAIVSVRAGFRDDELSRLWPARRARWRLTERRAGLFSHLFVAARGAAA